MNCKLTQLSYLSEQGVVELLGLRTGCCQTRGLTVTWLSIPNQPWQGKTQTRVSQQLPNLTAKEMDTVSATLVFPLEISSQNGLSQDLFGKRSNLPWEEEKKTKVMQVHVYKAKYIMFGCLNRTLQISFDWARNLGYSPLIPKLSKIYSTVVNIYVNDIKTTIHTSIY